MRDILARQGRVAAADIAAQGYELIGDAALRQLFAVASSLDSVVVGEPQVLGQVKDSHRLATSLGMMGPRLEAALRAAYGAAKRVHSGPQSASGRCRSRRRRSVARGVHGDLALRPLLLGGGGWAVMAIAAASRSGALTVLHKSAARRALPIASATTSGRSRRLPRRSSCRHPHRRARRQRQRSRRPSSRRCGAPAAADDLHRRRAGDIEAAVHDLDGAFRFDLGDLERLAVEGQSSRAAAAVRPGQSSGGWPRGRRPERSAVPTVVALRRRFETVRDQVLAENPGGDAATVARLLVNRLLHAPSAVLRELAANAAVDGGGDLMAIEHLLTRLFGAADADGAARDEEKRQ
jgi:glutamyl-tRNA reductase